MTRQAKAFEKGVELVVKATPEVLSPIIKTIVSEFEYEEGLSYWLIEESKSTSPSFRKILITALEIVENSIASEDCIGIITLQSLGSDSTLFRVPPHSHWYIDIKPKTLPQLQFEGIVKNDEFNLYWDESYFTRVLERLVTEFQRLRFIDLREEKPPIGFRLPYKEKNG